MKKHTKREYVTFEFPSRDWTFSAAVQEKALEIVEKDLLTPTDVPGEYRVPSMRANGSKEYLLRLQFNEAGDPQWATCECAHGVTAGFGRARCSHVYAALAQLGATK